VSISTAICYQGVIPMHSALSQSMHNKKYACDRQLIRRYVHKKDLFSTSFNY